jgi:hypothetical protein
MIERLTCTTPCLPSIRNRSATLRSFSTILNRQERQQIDVWARKVCDKVNVLIRKRLWTITIARVTVNFSAGRYYGDRARHCVTLRMTTYVSYRYVQLSGTLANEGQPLLSVVTYAGNRHEQIDPA